MDQIITALALLEDRIGQTAQAPFLETQNLSLSGLKITLYALKQCLKLRIAQLGARNKHQLIGSCIQDGETPFYGFTPGPARGRKTVYQTVASYHKPEEPQPFPYIVTVSQAAGERKHPQIPIRPTGTRDKASRPMTGMGSMPVATGKRPESAYKPDSVSWAHPLRDGLSLRSSVLENGHPFPHAAYPEVLPEPRKGCGAHPSMTLSLLLGLAPDGGCLAMSVT